MRGLAMMPQVEVNRRLRELPVPACLGYWRAAESDGSATAHRRLAWRWRAALLATEQRSTSKDCRAPSSERAYQDARADNPWRRDSGAIVRAKWIQDPEGPPMPRNVKRPIQSAIIRF